jgi:hypothetical protein
MSRAAQPWSHRWHDLQRRLAANAVLTGHRPTPPAASASKTAGIVRAVGTVKVGRAPWVLAPAGSWLLRARLRD